MPPNPVNVSRFDDDGLDDMTRQRHVYETAFDCRISKSDDDLDQIDKVTNHPVLVQANNSWDAKPSPVASIENSPISRRNRAREICQKSTQEDNNSVIVLTHDIKVRIATITIKPYRSFGVLLHRSRVFHLVPFFIVPW